MVFTEIPLEIKNILLHVDVEVTESPKDLGDYWTAPTGPYIEKLKITKGDRDITDLCLRLMNAEQERDFFYYLIN